MGALKSLGLFGSYLGEDGGPDGLNLLDLGGLDEGLELVGLESRDDDVSYQ